ncbi:MAG: nuclear transport factor 2 family protein [Gammaproteobacteria bacterium]
MKLRRMFSIGCLLLTWVLVPRANAAVCNTTGERVAAGQWFRQINTAWEHLDAAAATALFTKNAEYRDDPFSPPLRGEKAIRAYWDDVARGQRDVHTSYEVLSACGDQSIVHWQASFVRVPSGQKVRLDGIAEVTLDRHGKCVLFREWWNRDQK